MQYQYEDFEGCLNQPFTLELDDASSYPLILISVDMHPDSATTGDYKVFSVVFRGDKEPVLEQQIYHISNESLGELDLFMVPIGPDDSGMRYEAVFA